MAFESCHNIKKRGISAMAATSLFSYDSVTIGNNDEIMKIKQHLTSDGKEKETFPTDVPAFLKH